MKRKFAALLLLFGMFCSITGYAGVEDAKATFDKGDYAKALQEVEPLAQQGNADAQKLLGLMYYRGNGLPKDYKKAFAWSLKAAEQGHAGAQFNLGNFYINGEGVHQNYDKAVEWYRKAAEQGNVNGQVGLGLMYFNGHGVPQDYEKAAELFRKASEQGNAIGQANLGLMYFNGHGVPQNYEKAVEWYRKAADQGDKDGQVSLGLMYLNGHGVTQDYDKAAELFSKASEQGNANGQTNLGSAYFSGHGVPQDYEKAAELFRKAAKQGIAMAQNNLLLIDEVLKKEQLTKNDEARGYHRIAIADYQLDASSMHMGKKLIVSGFYEVEEDIQTLSQYPSFAIPNQYHIYLLTDNAPRDARKKLIDFQQPIQCGSTRPCQLTFLGHIGKCIYSVLGRKVRDTVCLDVDDIRYP